MTNLRACLLWTVVLVLACVAVVPSADKKLVRLRGTIVDADTGKPIPARGYIEAEEGAWLHVKTEDKNGSAVPYRKQVAAQPKSVEIHTTVSAHPFFLELPAGKYTIIVERGKEYLPLTQQVVIGTE